MGNLEPIGRLSHSQMTSYMECGEKYRLTRRRKLAKDTSWALLGGSAVHAWSEAWDISPIKPSPEYFVHLLNESVAAAIADESMPSVKSHADIKATGRASKEWPNKRNYDWWVHHGPIMCEAYAGWRSRLDNDLMPPSSVQGKDFLVEEEVKAELGGVEVIGYIDRIVLESPEHGSEPAIVDLKTGKEPGTILQLATYARLYEKQHGLPEGAIKHGYYLMAEQVQEFTEESTREWTEEELAGFEEERKARKAAIAAGETDADGKPLKPFRKPPKPKEKVVIERTSTLSEHKDVSAEKFPLAYIEGLYRQTKDGINAGIYLPNPQAFCGTCPVREFCGLYGGKTPEGVPMSEASVTSPWDELDSEGAEAVDSNHAARGAAK